jgi:periplasmic protein TonB
MSSSTTTLKDSARTEERRRSPRETLRHYVILVFFGEDNWGKLTNMSEGGMAFEFSRPPALHERVNFTFQVMGCMPMPHDASVLGESFEAAGEVVWLREFERLAGVQFVDLAEVNRKHIRQWLSFEASTNTGAATESAKEEELPLAAELTEPPLPPVTVTEEPETAGQAERKQNVAELDTLESPAEPVEEPESPSAIAVREVPEFPLPAMTDGEEAVEWQPNAGSSPASHASVARLTFLVVSSCLAAFAVTAGVRVFMARTAHRGDVPEGGANVSFTDPSLVSPSEAAPPFQVEVLDEGGKRWMLWFVRKDSQTGGDQISRRTETESPGLSSPPVRVAKEKDAAQAEELGTPHTYTLEAPNINRPADNGSAANNPVEEAPAIQKEQAVPQEEAGGGVLNSRITPPPLQVPVGGMVQQARLIHSVPPVYPALAKITRVSGDVVVDALIDASGNVKTVKVLSGPTILQQAAIETVRQWKYEPARLDGQAVAMHLSVTVKFRLN